MTPLAHRLAAYLRSCKCECLIDHLQRKGPVVVKVCARCRGLSEAGQVHPTDAEHALNVQLSALLNAIERDGWTRLDREDVAWLRDASAVPAKTGEG